MDLKQSEINMRSADKIRIYASKLRRKKLSDLVVSCVKRKQKAKKIKYDDKKKNNLHKKKRKY